MEMTNSELDIAVATEVMGWRLDGVVWVTPQGETTRFTRRRWHPSTDLRQAMEEVVETHDDQITLEGPLCGTAYTCPKGWWACRFYPHERAYAPTPARAICLAALAAARARKE